MMDEVRAPTGIPLDADVAAVQAHIGRFNEDEGLRPVTARVVVAAPVAHPVDVAIEALEPDTPELRNAIAASLAQMLLEEAEPGGSIFLSQWSGAIGFTPGVRRFVLVSPAAQVDVGRGEIAALAGVSYS